VKTEKQTAVT